MSANRQQLGSTARRNLDRRLSTLRGAEWARPPRGWLRAVRDALGMTTTAMARRVGVSQPRISQLERAEVTGTVTLNSLREAAEALDCELVYALLPRRSLDAVLRSRAEAIADRQLAWSGHTMALENQALDSTSRAAERERLIAAALADPARLWHES